ncbi:Short chain fatty acids transporter [Caballeronia glathei]|jgi:short-chain fatty acids transporter|uniref:Serine--pyruvate aminotransferase n=1 Tax=Caballeronia glathei TaxID=60547 RepID=A0A069PNI4_9BURK|nr:TIGR00366 family protein [Caballeronia glathei]KDR42218.1 serine--pyruvate aminotransferase [Caballeronia glathei]CDY77215.1 Short chain fatty acids transporter [Caballeronia glathei]
MKPASASHSPTANTRFTDATIRLFERVIPDPFVLAILITVIVAVASALFAPHASFVRIVGGWYKGFFDILTFAFQITLVLVTGHAFAHAPPVQRLFRAVVSIARTPVQASTLTFLSVAVASFFNWGFGLVVAALLAREVAKRMRVDFAWIVAAGFSGWVVWASGISSSIALAQSTHGSAMNVVEKLTGQVLPFNATVFTTFNLVPVIVMLVCVPIVLALLKPRDENAVVLDLDKNPDPPVRVRPRGKLTPAQWIEHSRLGSAFIGLAGLSFIVMARVEHVAGFSGVNAVIFVMFCAGVVLHGYPLAYADAVKNAARQTGSMMLQYPLYGGIMGIMEATGLPDVLAHFFIAISNAHTLPFWSYVCSLIVTFLVPSGGGHWAVQGPFVVPAAVALHASVPGTTMAVAMGEQVSNMMQPFWAAPVVAMAGIGVQRVLGYTVMTFLLGSVVFGAALLLLI